MAWASIEGDERLLPRFSLEFIAASGQALAPLRVAAANESSQGSGHLS